MPVLAYWRIRGLAQPIRLLLNYVGEDFEDKMYYVGEAPDYKKEAWNKDKFSIGLDFPNLPYYMDDKVKLSQSSAILRYLARKYNLGGQTEEELNRVDLMAEESMDFRNGLVRLSYNAQFESLKGDYLKNVPLKIKQFEAFLGDNDWFAGKNITWVDFVMYELLDQHRIMENGILNDTPKLKAFLDRFEALSTIKKYMESDNFLSRPINNKYAPFK